MAHKTLIGGTAYEIDGGKTLIGGTAYEIDKGKTLVGGTAYEVGFGPPLITFSINRSGVTTYQAEDGMTWGEWVNSAYNIDGYKIGSSNYVYTSNGAFYVTASGYSTPKSDIKILANVTYRTDKA